MPRLFPRTLTVLTLLVIAHGSANAYYINCNPKRVSLFHMAQYGAFYKQIDGSITYQYFNDVFDKKTVDPMCFRLFGGEVPLYIQPPGF